MQTVVARFRLPVRPDNHNLKEIGIDIARIIYTKTYNNLLIDLWDELNLTVKCIPDLNKT